ncbi:S1C family serine protease [Adhaeretor mobilis]|uniref:Periplasmic pH-dependent serine endoprotease DegQ n=1 Tax=Adhaeretor mobilis TaxID=1930276 RepID=A0A517MSV3_9BACT|nr:trypsin-like peptidase domain-containing protein [Adhaeretor mobilis]QDS97971.1 Periplasmic pH-dependent serine endoprotease DegQ precursor [Adhaeretor mobilis]
MCRVRTTFIAAGLIALGLAVGIGINLGGSPELLPSATAQPAEAEQPPTQISPIRSNRAAGRPPATEFTPEEQTNIAVYEAANRSVVNIDTKTVQVDHFRHLQHFAEGSGSGAVLDRDGHIITNYHVVDGARQIEVTLASNNVYSAELVGQDKEHDIAVLKIDAPADELTPISIGTSDNLRVGQRVFALGNPFGWDGTLTTGIISSLNRNLPSRVPGYYMKSLIQTDAAMNPGNSGGPLLNTHSEMIGMCVAIATKTGQNAGVGFAIPINRIRTLMPELIQHGRVVRADIGIVAVMETDSGLAIAKLAKDGPAARVGLRAFRKVVKRQQQGNFVYQTISEDRSHADRIVAINGQPMRTGVQFRDKILEFKPTDEVTLTIVREGKQLDVKVTLDAN